MHAYIHTYVPVGQSFFGRAIFLGIWALHVPTDIAADVITGAVCERTCSVSSSLTIGSAHHMPPIQAGVSAEGKPRDTAGEGGSGGRGKSQISLRHTGCSTCRGHNIPGMPDISAGGGYGEERGSGRGARGGGAIDIMHGRSRITIDPRIPTIPGRSTSGFHRPNRHRLLIMSCTAVVVYGGK